MKKRIGVIIAAFVLVFAVGVAVAAEKISTGEAHTGFLAKQTVGGAWTPLKTAFHSDGSGRISYCLEHSKNYPSGQSYSSYDGPAKKTRDGLVALLQHGYPTEKPAGLSATQARYATQNAVRSWLAECGEANNYEFMKLSQKRVKSSGSSWDDAFAWYKKLVGYAEKKTLLAPAVKITQKTAWTFSGGSYRTQLRVRVTDAQRYSLSLPSGVSIGSNKVNSASSDDTVDIVVPATLAGKALKLTANCYDDRAPGSYHYYKPGDSSKQRVVVVQPVEVKAASGSMTLTAPTGSLTLHKTDAQTGLPLAGAVFRLTGPGVNHLMPATDKNGVSSVSGLPYGNYSVTEVTAPAYHVLATGSHGVAVQGPAATLTVTNTPQTGRFRLYKYDASTKAPLPGARFQVFKNGRLECELTSGVDGYTPWVTGTLPSADWTAREVGVPAGYRSDGQTIRIPAITVDGAYCVTVPNTRATGLKLIKVDANDPTVHLAGVVFGLSKLVTETVQVSVPATSVPATTGPATSVPASESAGNAGNAGSAGSAGGGQPAPAPSAPTTDGASVMTTISVETTRLVELEELVTGDNGIAYTSKVMQPGRYYLVEKKTRTGYVLDPTPHPVDMEAGKLNEVLLENEGHPRVQVYKLDKDSGEPIPDTEFILYGTDDTTVTASTVWYEVRRGVTDSRGHLTFEMEHYGIYRVQENRPNADYADCVASGEDPSRVFTVAFKHPAPDLTYYNRKLFTAVEIRKSTIHTTSAGYVSLPGQAGIDNTQAGCDERYRYDIDYRSLSNCWADELTVIDPLEGVAANQIRLEELWTPISYGDCDGTFNLWYQTNRGAVSSPDTTANAQDNDPLNPANPTRARRIGTDGWRLWARDIGCLERRHFSVRDLHLKAGEYITGLMLEHGRVERGFTTDNARQWLPEPGSCWYSDEASAAVGLQPLSYLVSCPQPLSRETTIEPDPDARTSHPRTTASDDQTDTADTDYADDNSIETTLTRIVNSCSAHITRNRVLVDDDTDRVQTGAVSSFSLRSLESTPTPPDTLLPPDAPTRTPDTPGTRPGGTVPKKSAHTTGLPKTGERSFAILFVLLAACLIATLVCVRRTQRADE
ncbi:MAG: Cys-Gln thioester bond-forming surface protein [Actinomycetes bacterium]|jgi:TQXA domain-containing protein|nr:Cys-Gln thioester bond-forming surface protein [Actinomycetes bacterium]